MKIKTGIFSGSFNPVHIGHTALVNYICEYEGMDEVWFVVSPQNPLKQNRELLDNRKRLELVEAATQGYSRFKASDFEFYLPKPSYTYRTLEALKESFPDREFSLIIGADNWNIFPRWKNAGTILAENPILVYPRPGYPVDEASLPPTVRLLNTPMLEISATFIRESLEQGKDIRYFLHPEVYRLIKEEKLFSHLSSKRR
ncbi:MAG: nicotinate-nucleotide adenylyltransferase [Bacteroides sp.]|nr:nicotinate-nucleotide adenylyltransferase [Bacteroides sp.]